MHGVFGEGWVNVKDLSGEQGSSDLSKVSANLGHLRSWSIGCYKEQNLPRFLQKCGEC